MEVKLTSGQFRTLQNGHIPREMEDKWFSYFEDGRLMIHRSWSGFCIYLIRFSEDLQTADVLVNRCRDQYRETSLEKDRLQAMILLNSLAGRPGNRELMLNYLKLK